METLFGRTKIISTRHFLLMTLRGAQSMRLVQFPQFAHLIMIKIHTSLTYGSLCYDCWWLPREAGEFIPRPHPINFFATYPLISSRFKSKDNNWKVIQEIFTNKQQRKLVIPIKLVIICRASEDQQMSTFNQKHPHGRRIAFKTFPAQTRYISIPGTHSTLHQMKEMWKTRISRAYTVRCSEGSGINFGLELSVL